MRKTFSFLLISVCIIHLADYIIIPILPIFFTKDKGFTSSQVGLLIGISAIAFQIGSIGGGIISDKHGRRIIYIIGTIIAIISLIGLGMSNKYHILLLLQILNGIGSGMFAPTIKAAIAEISKQSNNTKAFSARVIAANLGVAIGGLIPLLAKNLSRSYFFYLAAIFYGSLIIFACFIPNNKNKQILKLKQLGACFKDKTFLLFNFLILFVWIIYIQIRILLPLRISALYDNANIAGSIWTITSLFIVFFQNFITKKLLKDKNEYMPIIIGNLAMGIGILSLGFSYTYIFILISSLIFISGEMLFSPSIDSITSNLADKSITGTYFSVTHLTFGLGSALGSFIAGKLIDSLGILNIFPWLTLFLFTLISSLIIYLTKIKKIYSRKI